MSKKPILISSEVVASTITIEFIIEYKWKEYTGDLVVTDADYMAIPEKTIIWWENPPESLDEIDVINLLR